MATLGELSTGSLKRGTLLPDRYTAVAERKQAQPTLFGGGELSVRGHYYTLCNERERTLAELAKEGFAHAMGW